MDSLAEDRLEGAAAIAEHLFGDRSLRHRVYYFAGRGLPVFRMGSTICASKKALAEWQRGTVAA